MITAKRQQLILGQLQQKEIITVEELCQLTHSSESTIRRDLINLEKQQLLTRVHGGAKLIANNLRTEPQIVQRQQVNLAQKRIIATYAANLVQDDEVIYLDSGTTTSAMIPLLVHRQNLLVVTNGVNTASLLADYQIPTIVLGGQLRSSTKAAVGLSLTRYLTNCHFDRAFMGTNGFDLQYGYTTPNAEESAVKQLAVQQATVAYVLSDATKYQQVRFSKFADLKAATLITDCLPPAAYQLLSQQTKILEAKK